MTQKYHILINDLVRTIECDPDRLLIDLLREDLNLTGTKRGCGIGACGSCSVLIDGKIKKGCRVKVSTVGKPISSGDESRETVRAGLQGIVTIEGLSRGDKLHPIQEAFIEHGAIQCGFCTPGMVLTAKALLDSNPHPSREEIKRALAGNLCRCTGYQQIFEAIEKAAIKCKS